MVKRQGVGVMPKNPVFAHRTRVELFLRHVAGMEAHPFFRSWQQPGEVRSVFELSENEIRAESGFDSLELETFATRIRQCVFPREAFYVDQLQHSVHATVGTSSYVESACERLRTDLTRRFSWGPIVTFKDNEEPATEGRTFRELLEAYLYAGRIHSERLACNDPASSASGWRHAHPFAHADLEFAVGTLTMMVFVPTIMHLRRGIYEAWKESGQSEVIEGLAEFESFVLSEDESQQ